MADPIAVERGALLNYCKLKGENYEVLLGKNRDKSLIGIFPSYMGITILPSILVTGAQGDGPIATVDESTAEYVRVCKPRVCMPQVSESTHT